ncbi:MAG: DedA family protein [Bdellovibrionales bacterium]
MQHTKFSIKLVTYLSGFSGISAYAAILGILLVCGLGVPIPEDITLVTAGILAALKSISLAGAILVGFIGVLLGDCILFFLGRRFGYRIFTLPLFRKIFNEKQIQLARSKVLTNSKLICFTARFLPGLRAPIYLTAGIMGVHPLVFLALDSLAALISVPVWVYVGWYFGSNLDDALSFAVKTQKYIVSTVIIILCIFVLKKFYQSRKEKEILAKTEPPPIPSEEVNKP